MDLPNTSQTENITVLLLNLILKILDYLPRFFATEFSSNNTGSHYIKCTVLVKSFAHLNVNLILASQEEIGKL